MDNIGINPSHPITGKASNEATSARQPARPSRNQNGKKPNQKALYNHIHKAVMQPVSAALWGSFASVALHGAKSLKPTSN